MSDTPRLSVVIPMRNCAHCVCAMLDSLLAQNISMQFVLIDDASEDNTITRVEDWSRRNNQPVEIVCNKEQMFSYRSRLKGLALASAPVVWCMDADDIVPPNANIQAALVIMEREKPDILHGKACGVMPGDTIQKPLPWTEPVAGHLTGREIFSTFMAQAYPPAILWNKFFSARLAKAVLTAAPDITVRYFDVKFLGLLFLLYAQSYTACNELMYEYRMRPHRPAWLYARQVDALLLLEEKLTRQVERHAPNHLDAFLAYCRRRLVIQTGHLSLMAEAELRQVLEQEHSPCAWLEENILTNLSRKQLHHALCVSLADNTTKLHGWVEDLLRIHALGSSFFPCLPDPSLLGALKLAVREWLCRDFTPTTCRRIAQCGMRLGLRLAKSELDREELASNLSDDAALALLLGNAQLARAITAIMAPDIDITRKAN